MARIGLFRKTCVSCNSLITKSSFINPHLCIWCGIENDVNSLYESRFDPRLI